MMHVHDVRFRIETVSVGTEIKQYVFVAFKVGCCMMLGSMCGGHISREGICDGDFIGDGSKVGAISFTQTPWLSSGHAQGTHCSHCGVSLAPTRADLEELCERAVKFFQEQKR